jgi:hypothetical protein
MLNFKLSIFAIALMSVSTFTAAQEINSSHSEDDLLQSDEFLLTDDSGFIAPEIEENEQSWKDYFVTSISHDQTRTDEGDTSYFRYALRVEYEQAFAEGWYTRVDVKATSYRSLDQQARQRSGTSNGDAYQKTKLQQAWIQYSRGQCVHKIGQQTLFWGKVDGTFAIDDITPFDFTEQLLTDYSNIRLSQPMLVSNCFINKQELQAFYIPKASLHLNSHNNDQYRLKAAANIDEDDLDAEWGARYKFSIAKTEIAFMFADLIANAPNQVLTVTSNNTVPPTLFPTLAEYKLYGISSNYSSGAWQLKSDIAYKTDQIVDGTQSEKTDVIDAAVGVEYLSTSNHSFNAGIWGTYALDSDIVADQNDSAPLLTLRWNKSYLNDDLDMSMLASGRSEPRSVSTTAQASYQYDDFWRFSSALTLVDADKDAANTNPLQSQNNEISLQIKYQF